MLERFFLIGQFAGMILFINFLEFKQKLLLKLSLLKNYQNFNEADDCLFCENPFHEQEDGVCGKVRELILIKKNFVELHIVKEN